MRDDPMRALLVVVGLVAAGLVIRALGAAPYLALLAVAALAVSLWRFFVSIAYELSSDGIDQHFLGRRRRLPWQAIRRYRVCASGLLFLPHASHGVMDVFRGLYLPWSSRREEVLVQVQNYLGPPEEA